MSANATPLAHELYDLEALTVAMSIAPGVYARNRMFAFYKEPVVLRARARAATIRGVVRQLASAVLASSEVTLVRTGTSSTLRYKIDSLRFERRLDMTVLEAACFVYLATRAGIRGVRATAEDRALLDAALKRLALDLV